MLDLILTTAALILIFIGVGVVQALERIATVLEDAFGVDDSEEEDGEEEDGEEDNDPI